MFKLICKKKIIKLTDAPATFTTHSVQVKGRHSTPHQLDFAPVLWSHTAMDKQGACRGRVQASGDPEATSDAALGKES